MSGTEGFEELDLGRRSRETPQSRPSPERPGPQLPPLSPLPLDVSTGDSSSSTGGESPGPPALPPDDQPGGRDGTASPPWQQWAALGAALAIGAVVGVVGVNARNNAADSATVELVAGALTAQAPTGFRDFELQRLALPLFNAGPRAIEVETIELIGWRPPEDTEGLAPITVDPGTWETINIVLLPDCGTRPRPTATVTARSESGTKTVELTYPGGDDSRVFAWESACSRQAPYGELQSGLVEVLERDATHLVANLRVQQFGNHELEVLGFWSDTPGLSVTTPILPFVLSRDTYTVIRIELRVTDCAAAGDLSELALYADVESTDGTLEQTQVPVLLADNRLLIEAARFSDDACET